MCVEVRTGDVVLVPHGYHGPSMAAPGYPLYAGEKLWTGTDTLGGWQDEKGTQWVLAPFWGPVSTQFILRQPSLI